LGPIPNPQSPIPNPQSPIPFLMHFKYIYFQIKNKLKKIIKSKQKQKWKLMQL